MAAVKPFESHGLGALLNLMRRGSEESSFPVLDVDGSIMSGAQEDGALMAESLHLNWTTALDPQNRVNRPLTGG